MSLALIDYIVFLIFVGVITFIIVKSLISKTTADSFYKGGGNTHWAIIGMSLIAADVSIGYIIGSAGVGFEKGLAVGSYGWTASVFMIIMALYILPKFMRLEILTLPQYLEMRYNQYIRLVVAIIMLLLNIVGLSSMFYSSAILIFKTFAIDKSLFYYLIWGAGILTSGIILTGGLKNIFKVDLILSFLILAGGFIVTIFCFIKIGGFENFMLKSENKVQSMLPHDDNFLPWTQVLFGSLWLLHINYWAFNQSIVQKVLVANSLSQAQLGMLFAASVKIIIPFLFVVPGIIGFELFGDSIEKSDYVFPMLLNEVVPAGLKGFVLVALSGSIIGVTNAILNASSTIFAYDIFKRFIKPESDNETMIAVSRAAIALTVILACLIAPVLDNYEHIFTFSQMIRSMVAPAILGIFLLGLFSYRTPVPAAVIALCMAVPVFLLLKNYFPDYPNANILGMGFLIIGAVMLVIRYTMPLQAPLVLAGKKNIRFERNLVVVVWSVFILSLLASVYIVFL
ncbi:MAG: SLC5 family protein [Cytophagaceae bacterium]